MAYWRHKPAKGLIFIPTGAVRYCAHRFRALLAGLGIVQSMSRKANCRANAVAESFFHSFKLEQVQGQVYDRRSHAQAAASDYVLFFNPLRSHSSLGYLAPNEHARRLIAIQASKSRATLAMTIRLRRRNYPDCGCAAVSLYGPRRRTGSGACSKNLCQPRAHSVCASLPGQWCAACAARLRPPLNRPGRRCTTGSWRPPNGGSSIPFLMTSSRKI